MKDFKLWFIIIALISVFSVFQYTSDLGEQGKLDSTLLRENIYPVARTVNGVMTNIKFRLRGQERHKQKIIILAADNDSIKAIGRWPWHRDVYASLIHYSMKMGAKVVGLDMVLSESEDRVPKALFSQIEKSKIEKPLLEEIRALNTDDSLAEEISLFKDRLVMGYAPSAVCQPRYFNDEKSREENCPVDNKEAAQALHADLDAFALPEEIPLPASVVEKTPLNYVLQAVPNLPLFSQAAKHSGSFYVSQDPDGYIRRYPLFFVNQNKIYPSLALEMARIVKGEDLHLSFTPDARVQQIYFGNNSQDRIPSTPLGYLDMNFHASNEDLNYPVVSVADFLDSVFKNNHKYTELFKDGIVLFGITALGVFDMRAFPFNSNSPGVEGHATALDNLLSADALRSASSINMGWLPLALLWIFGLLFGYLFSQLESRPSIAVFAAFLLIVAVIDVHFLFKNNINIPTAFLLMEVFSLFVVILSIRFIREEKNKKFIREAFSHYLAPQVVDYVLKDPSKLSIGGERRELSVLFTDIRGFTTLSENMEPKILSNFLNEYLTAMTDIIFENGGTLDKYIGDAVMAFWGAPIFNEDHAFQAAKACLQMQKKMGEMQAGFREKYGANLEMGVGLNSGMVSVGNMGSQKIFDYTVIGDHVNLASRLEGLNRIYGTGVLCSQFTLDSIPEQKRKEIHYRKLDSVIVKGKHKAIEIIELSLEPINTKAYELFCLAREEFKKRKWDEAIRLFALANTEYKNAHQREDSVCAVFIERCENFKINPPADNWDGSTERREK